MKHSCLILLLFGSLFLIFAACDEDDNPSEPSPSICTFEKAYNFMQHEQGIDILELSDGNFIIAANQLNLFNFRYSIIMIKTDEKGDTLWVREFEEERNIGCSSVFETTDGYIFGGVSPDVSPFFMTKLDTSGNVIWHYTYGTERNFVSNVPLIQTSNGNYLFVRGFEGENESESGIIFLEIDQNGSQVNEFIVDVESTHELRICEAEEGGYVLTYELYYGHSDLLQIHKIAGSGQTLWHHEYQMEDYWTTCYATSRSDDGGFILSGLVDNNEAVLPFLLRLDSNGVEQWSRVYTMLASFYDISETSDGGFIATGRINSSQLLLMKMGADGTQQWYHEFGQNVNNWGNKLEKCHDGSIAVVGATSDSHGISSILFIKTDPNGIVY